VQDLVVVSTLGSIFGLVVPSPAFHPLVEEFLTQILGADGQQTAHPGLLLEILPSLRYTGNLPAS
jgi:hypothetical protein